MPITLTTFLRPWKSCSYVTRFLSGKDKKFQEEKNGRERKREREKDSENVREEKFCQKSFFHSSVVGLISFQNNRKVWSATVVGTTTKN
jgi:hypothetical protein